MKLKIKDLFIGLEFKIEQEVEIPEEILINRIIQELRKLDYEVVDRTEKKISFGERWHGGPYITKQSDWDRVNKGSFEITSASEKQSLKFLFSVPISGPILGIFAMVGMFFAINYMVFPFVLIFCVLNTQRAIDIKNKMHEIFNGIIQKEMN
jgi:hypothetical protein